MTFITRIIDRFLNFANLKRHNDNYADINKELDKIPPLQSEVVGLASRVDTIIQGGGEDKDAELVNIRTSDPNYTPIRTINVAGDMVRDIKKLT